MEGGEGPLCQSKLPDEIPQHAWAWGVGQLTSLLWKHPQAWTSGKTVVAGSPECWRAWLRGCEC